MAALLNRAIAYNMAASFIFIFKIAGNTLGTTLAGLLRAVADLHTTLVLTYLIIPDGKIIGSAFIAKTIDCRLNLAI